MLKNLTIGWIGTGVMGHPIVKNLQQAQYTVNIYTRTKSKALSLTDRGAVWKDSVAELAKSSDIIFTMVGYPEDVEAVYFGEDGILNHAQENALIIDMTTSKPSIAQEIYKQALEKNIQSLDAPVSGGDIGAKEGKLAIMVGGDREPFEKVKPIFDVLGDPVILQGEAGAGQHTKLANQITIASNMVGVCEAIIYAKKANLDVDNVLKSISTGAAGSWSLTNLAPRMIALDYEPGFYIKHFIKDMRIALESAQEMGLTTPGLDLSLQLYEELEAKGEGDQGTQALIKYFL